ncbi:MAG: GNAT family N-acetyltransferase [Actinomycetota bacterium]|nr:GNAT family N-acetyltransferase [Actinomycetota bacterium]
MTTPRDVFDDATITGDGFELRVPSAGDVDAITAACQDLVTQRWLPIPVPYEREHALSFVTDIAPEQRRSGSGLVRVIEVAGQVAGIIDLKKTDWRAQVTEIGYWVGPAHRGHGLAGRATERLSRWAIEQQGMERVEITAASGNVASQRAAERAGFTREGLCRSAGYIHAGRIDLVLYARIRDDLDHDNPL